MTIEQQALFGTKNVRGSHYESLSNSAVSSNSRELDNTLSIQQPDGKPHVHVEFIEGLPIWRAALLVVNSALGAGILNFPQAYAECGGIATALTIQMVGVFQKQNSLKPGFPLFRELLIWTFLSYFNTMTKLKIIPTTLFFWCERSGYYINFKWSRLDFPKRLKIEPDTRLHREVRTKSRFVTVQCTSEGIGRLGTSNFVWPVSRPFFPFLSNFEGVFL